MIRFKCDDAVICRISALYLYFLIFLIFGTLLGVSRRQWLVASPLLIIASVKKKKKKLCEKDVLSNSHEQFQHIMPLNLVPPS